MMPGGPELADIHLPQTPSWWPPAPGWWLLALLLLSGMLLLGRWLLQRRRRRARLRLLQHELDDIWQQHSGPDQGAALVAGLSVALRRIARHLSPGAEQLQGEAWLVFLDAADAQGPYSHGLGRLLLDAPYRAEVPAEEARALFDLARGSLPRWVERADA